MKHFLKATGRAIKYGALKWAADRNVALADAGNAPAPAVQAAYLIGCGRSGTTVCGNVLKSHRDVYYFFEPYHLWAAIDPIVDVLNLYHTGVANLLLGTQDGNERARKRFNRLLLEPAHAQRRRGDARKDPVQRVSDRLSRCAVAGVQIHSFDS